MKDILTTLPRALQAELVEKKRVDVLINLTRKLALELEPTVSNLDKIADDVVASLSGWIYFNRWINDVSVYDPSREDVQWICSFSQFLRGLTQNTYTVNSKAYKTVDTRLREINKAICDIVGAAGEDWHIRYRCNNWDHEESWWWAKPWNDNDDHSRHLNLREIFESLDGLEDLADMSADEGSYLSQEWRKLDDELRGMADLPSRQKPAAAADSEQQPLAAAEPPVTTTCQQTKTQVKDAVYASYKKYRDKYESQNEAIAHAMRDNMVGITYYQLWRGKNGKGEPGTSVEGCKRTLRDEGYNLSYAPAE